MKLERILHVDDNEDMREIARFALETVGGFTLHQCSNGTSALQALQSFRPELLILDVMMPIISGPELFQRVTSIEGFEKTPVVYLTVKAQDMFAKSLRENGALGVIPKPFDPMSLAIEVKGLWNQSVLQTTRANDFDDKKVVRLRPGQSLDIASKGQEPLIPVLRRD